MIFSAETFGIEQSRRYRNQMLKAVEQLLVFPHMGSPQEHIAEGLRRLVHGSHAIYYSQRGDEIFIERILGPGQDPAREFS